MLAVGLVVSGTLLLLAAVGGLVRWAIRRTDIGTYAYARYLNHRRPLDKGWR